MKILNVDLEETIESIIIINIIAKMSRKEISFGFDVKFNTPFVLFTNETMEDSSITRTRQKEFKVGG